MLLPRSPGRLQQEEPGDSENLLGVGRGNGCVSLWAAFSDAPALEAGRIRPHWI